MSDLSKLPPVKLDQGKAQWVEAQCTGVDKDNPTLTHTCGIPHLMPCTIIFVHGVNSEGEWYEDAAKHFASGLNTRLGREDLKSLQPDESEKRLLSEGDGKRIRSPIIPFYWGYYVPPGKRCKVEGNESYFTDGYGNPLRRDGSWGGGPFQNGTGDLSPFWHTEGFRRKVFFDILDVNAVNPVIGRELLDCPDRSYYVHAARRLAFLIQTIRADLPNEPINIVAHSQGTMVSLCALFFLKQAEVRGPDTLMLTSSPYRFDPGITDFLAAAGGTQRVASADARVKTFANAATIVQEDAKNFTYQPAANAECTHKPAHRHQYDDRLMVHQPPDNPDWQAEIGAKEVDGPAGKSCKWWQDPRRARDNRGKVFVNFNPGDRVIGVSAVQGMGWKGIPSQYLDEDKNKLGTNVMQRAFVRGTDGEGDKETVHNPAPGSRTNFKLSYFYTQIDRQSVKSEDGTVWTTGSGDQLETVNENWHYLDGGSPNRAWFVASEKILGVQPVLGALGPRDGAGGRVETVWINAPLVPQPPKLDQDFDRSRVRYDGQADPAHGIEADQEQQQDFEDRKHYESPKEVGNASCKPQRVTDVNQQGCKSWRWETAEEVERRLKEAGCELVSPTNHGQILRYAIDEKGPVASVLSYDLTVGLGYAWGDAAYWDYLLKLADWKQSDPYFGSDESYVLKEKPGDGPPEGIVTATAAPAVVDALAGGVQR